jgi:hypothetical protein
MSNQELKIGDKILLYYMEQEFGVPAGTKGIVTKIDRDPFGEGEIVQVEWENGSTLNLLTNVDVWKKVKEDIQETTETEWYQKNRDLATFDLPYFKQYLKKLQNVGIVNMFEAAPFLYSGSEHIERYYGEGREDDEEFQEFLQASDESKQKFISDLVKYAQKNNKSLEEDFEINRLAKNLASKLVQFYMIFY